MATKFRPIPAEPQQTEPARVSTLWDRFEGSVHDHPLAWTVGMILVAGLVATYIGN